jgi:hypothetical protein
LRLLFLTVKVMHKLWQKSIGPHFGRFFSQIQLVTLVSGIVCMKVGRYESTKLTCARAAQGGGLGVGAEEEEGEGVGALKEGPLK